MKMVQVSADGKITLPKHLFKPADKVLLVADGDTVVLKKVDAPPLTSFADRAKARPMAMQDIVREVHAYRKAKRTR